MAMPCLCCLWCCHAKSVTINCDLSAAFGHVFVLNGPGGCLCKYRLGARCTHCTVLCQEYPELSELEEMMGHKMKHDQNAERTQVGKSINSAHHRQAPMYLRRDVSYDGLSLLWQLKTYCPYSNTLVRPLS